MSKPRLSEEAKDAIISDYLAGKAISLIAYEHGVDESYPRVLARRRGHEVRPTNPRSEKARARVAAPVARKTVRKPSTIKPVAAPAQREEKAASTFVVPVNTSGDDYDATSHKLMLDELCWQDCRWIVEETGSRALFCGHQISDVKSSYCTVHKARAYMPRRVAA